jgi:hypothetical protein
MEDAKRNGNVKPLFAFYMWREELSFKYVSGQEYVYDSCLYEEYKLTTIQNMRLVSKLVRRWTNNKSYS